MWPDIYYTCTGSNLKYTFFSRSVINVQSIICFNLGQYTEEEILDNNENSENFDEFLTILGQDFRSNSN